MKKIIYKIIIFFIFPILVSSCKTKKEFGSTEKEFVMAYKKAVLYGCINTATNNNLIKFSRENNDLGIAIETAILYHSEVINAQSIGGKLSEKIRTIDYSDYEGRKPIFSDCIDFAFSKKTDSIAKSKYSQLKKGKLVYITE